MESIKEEQIEAKPKKHKINEIPSSEYFFFQNTMSPTEKIMIAESPCLITVQQSDETLSFQGQKQLANSCSLYLETKQQHLFSKYSKKFMQIKNKTKKTCLTAFKKEKKTLYNKDSPSKFICQKTWPKDSKQQSNIKIAKIEMEHKTEDNQKKQDSSLRNSRRQKIPYQINFQVNTEKKNSKQREFVDQQTNQRKKQLNEIQTEKQSKKISLSEREQKIKKAIIIRKTLVQLFIAISLLSIGFMLMKCMDFQSPD